MKILIILFFATSLNAQLLSFQWDMKEKITLEKCIAVEVSVLGNAVIDYAGYNLTKNNPTALKIYRGFQYGLQATTTYALAKKYDIKTAIAFNVQMLGSNQDGYYFLIDGLSKGFKGFSRGNEFSSAPNFNYLNTNPMYWINGGRMNKSDLVNSILITKTISTVICSW